MEGVIDVSDTPKEIGMIVGEASSSEFFFSSDPDLMPSRWEYIVVYAEEHAEETITKIPVIAQVEGVISASQALTTNLDFEIIKKLVDSGLVDQKVWGKARVLGYLTPEGEVLQPRKAVMPGKPVYVAPKDLLEKFYSYPEEESLLVGNLITRNEVPVSLSIKGFRRHLALIAQTGAGKSYLAGVIAEEIIAKGGTIIMLDPHADYVFLSRNTDGKRHEFSDRISVFQNPASTGRYSSKEVGKVEPYKICFSDLDFDEICLMARISEKFVNIRLGLETAIGIVERTKTTYLPTDVLQELNNADSNHANWQNVEASAIRGAKDARKYMKRIIGMKVFSDSSTSIEKMLKQNIPEVSKVESV